MFQQAYLWKLSNLPIIMHTRKQSITSIYYNNIYYVIEELRSSHTSLLHVEWEWTVENKTFEADFEGFVYYNEN